MATCFCQLTLSPFTSEPAIFVSPLRGSSLQRVSISSNASREAVSLNGGSAESTRKTRRKGNNAAPSKSRAARKSKTQGKDSASEAENNSGSRRNSSLKHTGNVGFSDSDEDMYALKHAMPPLVCCLGAAMNEFMPTVRVSEKQMHPDIYSTWKGLQWEPPEFARAPGGPPSNMAIALARMGNRVSFMGKAGDDPFGYDLVYKLNTEKVETRGVKFDFSASTGVSYMKLTRKEGKLVVECLQRCAEDEFLVSDIDASILKEAKMFFFNSMALLEEPMHSAVLAAIDITKRYGGEIFFDLNLPLPLWKSRDQTKELIHKAWREANIIEASIHELDFLLDEARYYKERNYVPQYEARSAYEAKKYRRRYHYTREDLAPLWHDNIKLLLVTDATLRIHYYTPTFDGEVRGTEDVIVAHPYCDRTGSGDAIVAGIIRKLTCQPELYHDQDKLERQIRFAICAGIIAQWAIGSAGGLPTERAAQNLKESVFVPALW
eukprot:TRINITY_DN2663_c0_g1_i5.p1 TRINITY_DN2663_c0_g1~~TRINITY_DN2663_c0_g1_i5.p1  ORF type:complete len:491 (-),score=76.21 TRINITY_DN2663_c0_g1_i5:259-1731(-)